MMEWINDAVTSVVRTLLLRVSSYIGLFCYERDLKWYMLSLD